MITKPCAGDGGRCVRCTLEPLSVLGRAALAPDPVLGVEQVALQELGVAWENVFQEIVVRRASDVFDCAAASGECYDPLPSSARPVCVVLRFRLSGWIQPCFAELWPPHTLVLTPDPAAGLIERWLRARGFVAAR